ncbi:MAG: hypothetical protein C0483_19925 [Pirellula sp.]|nr:hypothetical protein [Pirellula sp.]
MNYTVDVVAILKPLFGAYKVPMKPATETSLNLFKARAAERKVPGDVATQLANFYSIVDGVPCLDSLDIHRCDDLSLFAWWDQQELWLGQRDFYTLRWSSGKKRFCIGDAGNVSFSESNEYPTFAEALRHMVKLYD